MWIPSSVSQPPAVALFRLLREGCSSRPGPASALQAQDGDVGELQVLQHPFQQPLPSVHPIAESPTEVPAATPPGASPASSTQNLLAESVTGTAVIFSPSLSRMLKVRCTTGSLTSCSSLELKV